MDTGSSLRKEIVIFFVLVGLLLFGGAFYYGSLNREQETETYAKNLQEGKKDLRALDGEAISKLEEAAAAAPSADDEATAKLDLAVAYSFLLQDPSKGLATSKEIVENTSYAGRLRARSLLKILFGFMVQRMDIAFAKEYIFTANEPWRSFVEGSADMEEATKKAYEWALQYGEWPSARYYIASWYGARLLEEKLIKTKLPDAVRSEYREKFVSYTAAADKWLPDLLAAPHNEAYEKAMIVGQHGKVHAFAYMLDGKKEERATAEQAFTQALDMMNNLPDEGYNVVYRRWFGMPIQLDYAIFLAYDVAVNHEKNLKGKVHELVVPITQISNDQVNVIALLKNIGALPKNHLFRRLVLYVAEADPEFTVFLKGLGWSL